MTCQRCGVEDPTVVDHALSGFLTPNPPTWTLGPHCVAAVDDAWGEINAAVDKIGRTLIDVAAQFNPINWVP